MSSGKSGGLILKNVQAADTNFYRKKTLAEKELGRKLSDQEFLDGIYEPGVTGSAGCATGTSIFDPVLCELAYRWLCPRGGLILDPFAGGSVRGVVASRLGRRYLGVDLRGEQVEANREQAAIICAEEAHPTPEWIKGDSLGILDLVGADVEADFLFSCPPYGDLEVYSDDPADLSQMEAEIFDDTHATIIERAAMRLKDNRFACWVVGDYRRKDGSLANFPAKTVAAFEQAGLKFYNEAVLVTAVGSLPIRAGRAFATTRKLGKTHQNVLIFIKGDPRKAVEAIGEVEFGDVEALGGEGPETDFGEEL